MPLRRWPPSRKSSFPTMQHLSQLFAPLLPKSSSTQISSASWTLLHNYRAGTKRPLDYQYWGTRIVDLHEEIEHPTPRGILWRWLERKSGARYAREMSFPLFIVLYLFLPQRLTAHPISDGDSGWCPDCSHSWNPWLGSEHLPSVGGVVTVAAPDIEFLSSRKSIFKICSSK